jgi:hypothetical protein
MYCNLLNLSEHILGFKNVIQIVDNYCKLWCSQEFLVWLLLIPVTILIS